MSDPYTYVGQELDLFACAVNWKTYFASHLLPFICGRVLEVGAGIGTTFRRLCQGTERSWTCLEPDAQLADRLRASLLSHSLPLEPDVIVGTTASLASEQLFDAVLYVDVLEHIENDGIEFQAAAKHLAPHGCLIVLAPAHQGLYTPFDQRIGHFRRYDKAMMKKLSAPGTVLEKLFYLDCAGLLLSLGNRLLLKSGLPTPNQIRFWDGRVIPLSRVLDPLLGHTVGKTIVGIWRKEEGTP